MRFRIGGTEELLHRVRPGQAWGQPWKKSDLVGDKLRRQVKGGRLSGLRVRLLGLSGPPWGENGGACCCGTRLCVGVLHVGVRGE